MSITINPASFTVTSTETKTYGKDDKTYIVENGTVELNLRTGTVVAEAYRLDFGSGFDTINVRGFVGRYVTSPKPWPASVSFKEDGTLGFVHFGRDDRSGRFNKRNAISYEPDTYASL